MKPDEIREKLVMYVERKEYGLDGLSDIEIIQIEKLINNNSELQKEVNTISHNLKNLKSLELPQPSEMLASKCLAANGVYRVTRVRIGFIAAWAVPVLALCLIMVFGAGVWFGKKQNIQKEKTFFILLAQQNKMMERLESGLASHYKTEKLDVNNPWYRQLANVRHTTGIITGIYKEHSYDPVVEKGLSDAIVQNIRILQTLCEYIESEERKDNFEGFSNGNTI